MSRISRRPVSRTKASASRTRPALAKVPARLELGPLLDASCTEDERRWTLVLVRDLSHSPGRVWDVLTDPQHLNQWAPFAPDRNLGRVGDLVVRMIDGDKVDEFPSRVTVAQAPEVLEYTWGEDVLRFGLEATASGTRLVLRHTMKDRNFISGVSAGWHMCLAVADRLLQGRPFGPVVGRMARAHGWDELNLGYAEALGVPPMKWPFD